MKVGYKVLILVGLLLIVIFSLYFSYKLMPNEIVDNKICTNYSLDETHKITNVSLVPNITLMDKIVIEKESDMVADSPWKYIYYSQQKNKFWINSYGGYGLTSNISGWFGPYDGYPCAKVDRNNIFEGNKNNITVTLSGGNAMLAAECANLSYINESSDYIIEGTVESSESKWINNSYGNHIVTFSNFKIEKIIKGNNLDGEMILERYGGTIDGVTESVEDVTILDEGKKLVLYLKEYNNTLVPFCNMVVEVN